MLVVEAERIEYEVDVNTSRRLHWNTGEWNSEKDYVVDEIYI